MILKEILEVKGYKARTIQLVRQLGTSYDTHVLTEIYNEKEKKFILLDPTFNLMFKSDDTYVNTKEVRSINLYKEMKLEVVENIQKQVAKYKEYYVDYFSLHNNVLIVNSNSMTGYKRLLSKLPIFHNYLGGKYYVSQNDSVAGISILYKIFYLYIPIFLLLNLFVFIMLMIKNIFKRGIL